IAFDRALRQHSLSPFFRGRGSAGGVPWGAAHCAFPVNTGKIQGKYRGACAATCLQRPGVFAAAANRSPATCFLVCVSHVGVRSTAPELVFLVIYNEKNNAGPAA